MSTTNLSPVAWLSATASSVTVVILEIMLVLLMITTFAMFGYGLSKLTGLEINRCSQIKPKSPHFGFWILRIFAFFPEILLLFVTHGLLRTVTCGYLEASA